MNSFFSKKNKGFSLVELIVVVAIFLIITSIALTRQSKFSSDILISNLAYEFALSIREAQVYGIGSKVAPSSVTGDERFKVGYGINLNLNTPSEYNFFTDIPNGLVGSSDNLYDDSVGSGEFMYSVPITRNQKIKNFCGIESNGTAVCAEGDTDRKMHISFVRPNPDAYIFFGNQGFETRYPQGVVVLESSTGDKCRIVRVTQTGQIAVDPIPADGNACDEF